MIEDAETTAAVLTAPLSSWRRLRELWTTLCGTPSFFITGSLAREKCLF